MRAIEYKYVPNKSEATVFEHYAHAVGIASLLPKIDEPCVTRALDGTASGDRYYKFLIRVDRGGDAYVKFA